MSTNIMSTNSNGNGTGKTKPGAPGSGHAPGQVAQGLRFPFATFPIPDPATLERLANEFFLAMPRDLSDADMTVSPPPQPETEDIPVTMFEGPLPVRETSMVESAPSLPASSPPYIQPGPLTEADLRAIAASLAGETTLVPGTPGTAPTPPVPGSPSDLLAGGKIPPFAVAPTLPPGNELFSFPGISATPTSAPTAPPGGGDASSVSPSTGSGPAFPGSTPYFLQGEKGTSTAAAPVLPPIPELFSFPRVPAMPNIAGIQTTPKPPSPISSPSAAPPSAAEGSDVTEHDVKGITPQVPGLAATDAHAVSSAPTTAEKAPSAAVIASLPSTDMLAFSAVPGVQSALAKPAPSMSSSAVPTEASLQTAVPPQNLPAVGRAADVAKAVPASRTQNGIASTTPPSAGDEFELRPDLAPSELGVAKRPLDAKLIRRDFPILEERVHGKPLVWLDNAATTQKPNAVINRLSEYYQHENSNIHRAAHELAARSTDAYESAREKSRRFLNASSPREIVFVRGATEAINLVAQSWGRRNVRAGDEVVITWLEHHANIVPWQMLCSEKGARLRVAPVNDRGEIILEEYEKLFGPRTRIVSFSQVSNALGTVTPVREMTDIAHRYGARVLVDGAQSVSHMPVDVQALGCDFFVFSGHKVFGPTGIGVLYGRTDLLDSMPPWQGGGNMIADVTFERTTYQASPARFEAGTGNIADAVGLGAALDYVDEIGRENIAAYEHDLLNYGTAKLLTVPGLRVIGTAREKAGVISCVIEEIRSEEVGVALNQEGIAVRAGHHCAQPILRRMGVESTVRPSLAFYNTCEDIDALVAALLRLQAGRGHRRL
jgi:cysteine desulfurase / selenocysteine lyase